MGVQYIVKQGARELGLKIVIYPSVHLALEFLSFIFGKERARYVLVGFWVGL